MIRIDTDELERLIEVFLRLESDVDNILGKTSMLRNEMLSDAEFMAHPNSESVVSILDNKIDSFNCLNEDIRSVESLFNKAKEDFSENEKELIKAIEEINNRLDSIISQLDTTISSDQVVVIDRSEELKPVNEVEKLVSGSLTDLELTNISALSQLAKKKMEVKEIKDKE